MVAVLRRLRRRVLTPNEEVVPMPVHCFPFQHSAGAETPREAGGNLGQLSAALVAAGTG